MSDQLDKDWRDRAALIIKFPASLVPLVGGPLAELITETIPRLRQERIVEYLRELNTRLENLQKEVVKMALEDAEKVDLIESGGHLAARATSPVRIGRIAEIVFRGLTNNEVNFVRRKRLLGLFEEIDDDEFLILNAYGQSYGGDGSQAWENIDRPPPAVLGSSADELDDAKLYDLGTENLLRLGLLEKNYGHVKRGEYPPFDPQSDGFKSRIGISYVGRMLLKEAGINLQF
ncbi:hypothetical protein F4212_13705 [Candidatus Poribacteria bacterium]|nr:hypothetical protein [Gammaproteobacteria bacterium]MYG00170.1 hypothetical protein [Candidatus Poribacteria bacterium]